MVLRPRSAGPPGEGRDARPWRRNDDAVDRDKLEHAYQRFLAEYRETFGPAPIDVWPDTIANCGSECEQQCQGQCASSD